MNRKNFVLLEGNICNEPKYRTFQKQLEGQESREISVVDLTLAVDGGRNGISNEVFFAKLQAFDKGADLLKDYRKGDKLLVWATARNNEWVNRDNIKCREVVFRVNHFLPINIKEFSDEEE